MNSLLFLIGWLLSMLYLTAHLINGFGYIIAQK